MQYLIDGKLADTEKAELVLTVVVSPCTRQEIYKTAKGAFVYLEYQTDGGAEPVLTAKRIADKIFVQSLLEKTNDIAAYRRLFGEPEDV